jgi:hypothetical protein
MQEEIAIYGLLSYVIIAIHGLLSYMFRGQAPSSLESEIDFMLSQNARPSGDCEVKRHTNEHIFHHPLR